MKLFLKLIFSLVVGIAVNIGNVCGMDFKDKVALVTGGYDGLGLATAKAFASHGAKVVIADINPKVTDRAEELKKEGYDILGLVVDVSDEGQVKSMVEKALETFGKLDCAYNNVGIHAPVLPSGDLELNDFIKVLNVNLVGCFSCMKYELKAMEKFGKGAIVNCSSQSGIVGTAGLSAYTASKHGVIGMTKCAGLEYAKKGIRVNAICPGTCDTPMVAKASAASPEHMEKIIADIPFGRMGRPEEIAAKVLFLCSDLAEFMVGQVLVADGGFTVP